MGYKLAVEKQHRITKGGTHPRKITKGEPFGRILKSRYDADKDQIVMTHATRGIVRRNRVGFLGPAQD